VSASSGRKLAGSITAVDARVKGRPRTNIRGRTESWSMQSGPMVSVSQPAAVHSVTIGMSDPYPLLVVS
jgi:hypothetical protein